MIVKVVKVVKDSEEVDVVAVAVDSPEAVADSQEVVCQEEDSPAVAAVVGPFNWNPPNAFSY